MISAHLPPKPSPLIETESDVVEAARSAGGFTVFLNVIETAGMMAFLKGAKRHTVFAPTDEAFEHFPVATLAKLLSGEHAALLKAVVGAHLVAGSVSSRRLQGKRIRGKSIQGSDLVIVGADTLSVNGAIVVRPDIPARNGVLHGIDRVLWPELALGRLEAVSSL